MSLPPPAAKSASGLSALEASVLEDLKRLDYPKRPWVLSRKARDGRPILDVLIVGGGQSGLAAAFGLVVSTLLTAAPAAAPARPAHAADPAAEPAEEYDSSLVLGAQTLPAPRVTDDVPTLSETDR